MFEMGNFLIIVAVALALIMVAVQVYRDIIISDDWGAKDALGILQFVLVLLVASIPVAMPAVFSITMALGALALSKQRAIVSKLSAIEEMAGVDILCSDKTGTLTKNQLTLGNPILFSAKSAQDCILAAALASTVSPLAIFFLGGIRLLTERFTAYQTVRQAWSVEMVNQALQLRSE